MTASEQNQNGSPYANDQPQVVVPQSRKIHV